MAEKQQAQGPTPLATPEETAARETEALTEWGTWMAVGNIYYGGVLAYTAGDLVPASNVAKYGYDRENLVVKQNSREAQNVIRQIHETGIDQPIAPPSPPVSLGVTLEDDGKK